MSYGGQDHAAQGEALIKLEEEVKRLKAIEKVMLAAPDQQVSFTDPDSRSMATSGRGSGDGRLQRASAGRRYRRTI